MGIALCVHGNTHLRGLWESNLVGCSGVLTTVNGEKAGGSLASLKELEEHQGWRSLGSV